MLCLCVQFPPLLLVLCILSPMMGMASAKCHDVPPKHMGPSDLVLELELKQITPSFLLVIDLPKKATRGWISKIKVQTEPISQEASAFLADVHSLPVSSWDPS